MGVYSKIKYFKTFFILNLIILNFLARLIFLIRKVTLNKHFLFIYERLNGEIGGEKNE